MNSYLRQLSIGEIFRGCFTIYRHHFFIIAALYFLPLFPFEYLKLELLKQGEMNSYWLAYIISLLPSSLAYAAITVALSDICLGNRPRIMRSYKYVFGPIIWKLLATNLLQIVVMLIGFVLLIVPGIIFSLWLIFVPIIVVLENTWGIAAFKRSKNLGKGYYLRTFLLLALIVLCVYPFIGIVGFGLGMLLPGTAQLLIAIVSILVTPLILIVLVLLYYDLRARKEAYDTVALAEDLQH